MNYHIQNKISLSKNIMSENLKKIVNYDFIYLLIFFTCSYRFFYTSEFNTIGHHWDHVFPISNEIIQGGANFFYPYFSYFKEFNIFLYSSTWTKQLINIFLNVDKYGILIFYFIIHIVSFYSLHFFLNFFFKNKCLFSQIFYSFSPFFFSNIISGNLHGQVFYSIAPLCFVCLFKLLNNNNNRIFIVCFILNLLLISNLAYYIQFIFILIFFFLFFTNEEKKIKKIFIFFLLIIIINLWWLYPTIFVDNKNTFASIDFNNILGSHYNNSQNFILNLLGLGFLDRDFFNNILDFKIIYMCFFFFTYYKILKIKKSLMINFTLICLLILSIISSEITSNLYDYIKIYIFQIKIFSLFRSPQNLLFLYPLLFAIMFYLVFSKYKKTNQFLLICIFLYPWIWEGDLGHDKLKKNYKNVGFVDFVKKDKDYINTLKYINENYYYNSIIFYPYTSSPLFKKNDYQNMNQGTVPEYLYLKPKVFHSEYQKNYLENTVKDNKNLKYIILRNDIFFHHIKPTLNESIKDVEFIKKNKIEKIIGNFEIRKLNTYDPTIKACNKINCLSIKNFQIKEFSTNIYFINNLEKFMPEYFVINDTSFKVLALPKIFKNNFNTEISHIAYEDIQVYLLIGWFYQIILIFLYILIHNLKLKNIYVRK
jgi:hypothetical protein